MWASAAKKEFPFEFREAFLTEPLPVKHGSVDFAICSEVVEHMEQPAELLNSIFAILKPGGCLVLTTDNSPSLPQLIRRIPRWLVGSYSRHYAPVVKETEIEGSFERKGKTTFIYGHISLKSTWEWEKIARQAGFDIARYGTYQSIRRGGAGCRPGVLAAYFLAGFLNSCLPRSLGRYCGDTTALLLKKPAGPSETTTQSMGGS
jgi:SAM-dependent methyltransferase